MLFYIVGAFIIILIIFKGIQLYLKNKVKVKLKKEFGQTPVRNYDERDFNYIEKLYHFFPVTEDVVDDGTWNDLQMPTMYKKMNHTQSIIGDQFLYRYLRQQNYSKRDVLEKHINYFSEDEKMRLETQYLARRIKGRNENKLMDLLDKRSNFPKIPYVLIYSLGVLGIIAIISMILTPVLGFSEDFNIMGMFLFFIISLCVFSTVVTKAAPVVASFNVYNKMYSTAKYLNKALPEDFIEEKNKLTPAINKLSKTHWITSFLIEVATAQGGTAGILTCIGIYFGIYGVTFQWLRWYFQKYKKEIIDCIEIVGYIETCISLASYRETLDFYCHPDFTNYPCVDFTDIYHPLIKKPVCNTHQLAIHHLITGANASGKSTFARTVALSVLLGQTINTCFAKKMTYL